MYLPGERGAVSRGDGVPWIGPLSGRLMEHPAEAKTTVMNNAIGVAKLHAQSLSISTLIRPLVGPGYDAGERVSTL